MAFKEYSDKAGFMDLELGRIFGNSRTQRFLSGLDSQIDWGRIDELLLEDYPVGKSQLGNRAYPPLMLLKALLLQKWFGIKSDPELENQINDRISFKVFIGLPLAEPSPDHSIICRFRDRVGQETLEKIHGEILHQFKALGFSIESGMAVDARLIRSASRPVSGKKLEGLREKRKSESGQKDKNGRSLKFQRDVDSDWTVKNGQPVFGMKESASLDVESGFVLSTLISRASEHDTNYFQAAVVKGIHGENLPPKVYADKGYCGEPNRAFLGMNGIGDGIMRKDQINAKLGPMEIERNRMISKVRYKVEQYFGLSHLHQGGGKARFTTLAKEGWDRLCGAMAFNIKRAVLATGRKAVPATE